MFSCHNVFRFTDPANFGKSLLDGNKDHVLDQARSELMKQDQLGPLNNCIEELQQQAHAQRLADVLNHEENNLDYKKNYL